MSAAQNENHRPSDFAIVAIVGDKLRLQAFNGDESILCEEVDVVQLDGDIQALWHELSRHDRKLESTKVVFIDHAEKGLKPLARRTELSSLLSRLAPRSRIETLPQSASSLLKMRVKSSRNDTLFIERADRSVSLRLFERERDGWSLMTQFKATERNSLHDAPLECHELNLLANWLVKLDVSTLEALIMRGNTLPDQAPANAAQFCLALQISLSLDRTISKFLGKRPRVRIVIEGAHWSDDILDFLAMYRANDELVVLPRHHDDIYARAITAIGESYVKKPAIIRPAAYFQHAWQIRARWTELQTPAVC